ncbi:hypothetical protein N9973_00540 [bacterium]|nr:hypothetical protein [bacterium]
MANILTIPESGIFFDGNTAGVSTAPILTGDASGVAIQYDGYAGVEISSSATGVNYLDRFSVEGANGRLFGVTDEVTGTIFSVNDAAGLPIIEVESTADFDKITIGEYGTDALVVSGDSVGIGTTSPAYQLTLGGNAVGSTEGLRINDPSNAAYGAHFSFSDTPNEVWIGGVTNNTYNSAIGIHRDTTRAITIDDNGNVGIGTTSPIAKLDIRTPQTTVAFTNPALRLLPSATTDNTGLTSIYLSVTAGTSPYGFSVNAWRRSANNTFTIKSHIASATGVDRLVIQENGNVGIGTTSPSQKLDVYGGAIISGNVGIGKTSPNERLDVAGNIAVSGYLNLVSFSSSRSKLRLYGGSQSYAIGMESAVTFAGLNDWAMTFQFNNVASRGFWWGDDAHTSAQGAMALTTNGLLTVASKIRVGFGESDTTTPSTYDIQTNDSVRVGGDLSIAGNVDIEGFLTAGPQDLSDSESVLPQGQAKEVFAESVDFFDHIKPDNSNITQTGGSNGSITSTNNGRILDFRAGTTGGATVYELGACYSTPFRPAYKPFPNSIPFEIQIGLANLPYPNHSNTFRINLNTGSAAGILADDGTESGVIAELQRLSDNSGFKFRLGVAANGTMTWSESSTITRYFSDAMGVMRLRVSGSTARLNYYSTNSAHASDNVDLTLSGVTNHYSNDANLAVGGWVNLTATSNSTSGGQSTCAYIQYIKIK